jgi:hypothetical protein
MERGHVLFFEGRFIPPIRGARKYAAAQIIPCMSPTTKNSMGMTTKAPILRIVPSLPKLMLLGVVGVVGKEVM